MVDIAEIVPEWGGRLTVQADASGAVVVRCVGPDGERFGIRLSDQYARELGRALLEAAGRAQTLPRR